MWIFSLLSLKTQTTAKTYNGGRVSLTDEKKPEVAWWIKPQKDLLFSCQVYRIGVSNAAKSCWTKVHNKAIAARFPVVSVKQTRENLWDNKKRSTMKKIRLSYQTGQGCSSQFTDLGKAVLDIIGRDSVYLNSTGLEDDHPVLCLHPPSCSRTDQTRKKHFFQVKLVNSLLLPLTFLIFNLCYIFQPSKLFIQQLNDY